MLAPSFTQIFDESGVFLIREALLNCWVNIIEGKLTYKDGTGSEQQHRHGYHGNWLPCRRRRF